MVAILLEPNIQ